MLSLPRPALTLPPPFGSPRATRQRTLLLASIGLGHVALVLLLLHGIAPPSFSTIRVPLAVTLLSGAEAPATPPADLPLPAPASLPGAATLPIPALNVEAATPPAPPAAPEPTPAVATPPAAPPAPAEAAPVRPPMSAAVPPPPQAPSTPPPRRLEANAVQYLVPPPAEVPRASRRAGESGTVWLRVVVDTRGLPASVTLHRSSGHARLDEQALWAMRQARFTPHREDGRAVEVEVIAPIEYPPG